MLLNQQNKTKLELKGSRFTCSFNRWPVHLVLVPPQNNLFLTPSPLSAALLFPQCSVIFAHFSSHLPLPFHPISSILLYSDPRYSIFSVSRASTMRPVHALYSCVVSFFSHLSCSLSRRHRGRPGRGGRLCPRRPLPTWSPSGCSPGWCDGLVPLGEAPRQSVLRPGREGRKGRLVNWYWRRRYGWRGDRGRDAVRATLYGFLRMSVIQ